MRETLEKLLVLSKCGVDGERENASKLLKKLMKKYNISEEQLNEDLEEWYKFKIKNEFELKLLSQVVYKVVGYGVIVESYRKSKTVYMLYLTPNQKIEIEYLFTIYKNDFSIELEKFYKAFISKNNIFPKNAPQKSSDISYEDYMQIYNLMSGINRSNIYKGLK